MGVDYARATMANIIFYIGRKKELGEHVSF